MLALFATYHYCCLAAGCLHTRAHQPDYRQGFQLSRELSCKKGDNGTQHTGNDAYAGHRRTAWQPFLVWHELGTLISFLLRTYR